MVIRCFAVIIFQFVSVSVFAGLQEDNPGIENLPFAFTLELKNHTEETIDGLRFNVSVGLSSADGNDAVVHPSIFPHSDVIASGNNSNITWSGYEVAPNQTFTVGGWIPGSPANIQDCCAIDYAPGFRGVDLLADGEKIDQINLLRPWFARGTVAPKAFRVTYYGYQTGIEYPAVLGRAWYMGTGSASFGFYNSTDQDISFSFAEADPVVLITNTMLSDDLFDFGNESDILLMRANSSDIARPVPIPPAFVLFGSAILGLFGFHSRRKTVFQ